MNASRIQHNIASMNSYRNYTNNSNKLGSNLEKLSSGYKINRAGDDAAGLAISEKMRAQITGLEVAQKNAKDGISVVQTAEGALTEVHDMLNRMYSLAEQSANGIYQDAERQKLQDEIDALTSEIDRISQATNFNGIAMLDGSLAGNEANVTAVSDVTGAVATLTKPASGTLDTGVISGATGTVDATIAVSHSDATTAAVAVTVDLKLTTAASAAFNFDIVVDTNSVRLANGSGSTVGLGDVDALAYSVDVSVGGKTRTVEFTATAASNASALGDIIKSAVTTAFSDLSSFSTSWGFNFGSFAVANDGTITGGTGLTISFAGVDVDAADANKISTFSTTIASAYSAGAEDGYQLTIGNKKVNGTANTLTAAQVVSAITGALDDIKDDFGVEDFANAVSASLVAGNSMSASLTAAATGSLKADALNTALSGSTAYSVVDEGGDTRADITVQIGSQKFTVTGQTTLTSGTDIVLTDANTASAGATIQITLASAITDDATAATMAKLDVEIKDTSLVLQIGDDNNTYNQLKVAITSMGAANLFGTSAGPAQPIANAKDGNGNAVTRYVDIMDADKANLAMGTIKDAIEKVSVTRGNLGAIQNRLEHTINNLGTTRENLQDAESAIRDTDVAEEMMKYTKNSIMNQAAQAMLAQANQLPQGVLQLLQ